MKRTIAAAVVMVVAGAAAAHAGVNLNVNLNVPAVVAPVPPPSYQPEVPAQLVLDEPPRFIYSPELGFYLSVDVPYDIAYINRSYYLYSGGYWYLSRTYWGPWAVVSQHRLPSGLRRYRYEQIRNFRDRQYQVYMHDRERYRGTWYHPTEVRKAERRMEHKEQRREERREEHSEMRDRR
jgi:hypothetical protein